MERNKDFHVKNKDTSYAIHQLTAPVHPKCSYAWRSILNARGVIEKGAIWRVGSGQLIDVWHHRWLPDLHHSKIISPYANTSVSRVCDLFIPGTRTWDPGRLASCFLPWKADMVRKIQVCDNGEEDSLIWPLTSDGAYSVRSAYRMLVANENLSLPSSSASTGVGSVWKKIWKVQVPNKIRHFLWRAAKDSLPTKQNLVARHIPVGNICDGCGDHSESVLHALWLYDQVRSVWMSDPGFLFLVQAKCRSFMQLLEVLFAHGSGFRIALFTVVEWSLWQYRNRMREHQSVWPLHELGDWARTLLVEFWEVHPQEQREPSCCPQVRWSPPPAFFEESGSAGVGVVVRDCSGQIIGALRQNIGSGIVVGFLMKGSGRCRTLFGHIIDEAKRLGGTLRSRLFQHVRRKGNRLAHCLAKKVVLSTNIDVWVESLPEDVEDVYHLDLP
ncbi:hypothetical protein ACB092_08G047800 [Castanea dentata]